MAKKTNMDLVVHAQSKLGVHYLYGAKGQNVTASQIKLWGKLYPKYYGNQRIDKALNWVGQPATDCSGLISWLTSIEKSSSTYYSSAAEKGTIKTIPEILGLAVWKQGHIGIYIGNGQVIEARGFDYGVVQTKLQSRPWTHWLKLSDINYDYIPKSITRQSSKQDIIWLQSILNIKMNAKLTLDGIYGTKTATAYKEYARSHGWQKPDGWSVGSNGIKSLAK